MGAPQNRLSEIAKQFVDRGHEVIVLTAMPNYPTGKIYPGYGGFYREEIIQGVTVKRTWIYPTKKVGLHRLLSYFSFVFSSIIAGALRLPKVDYILTESPPLFLGFSGFLLSRLKRARLIFNVSDLWPESAVHMGMVKDGLSLKLAWWLEKFCYRKSWLVSGQSREILQNIQARFPAVPTHHLSNGVDTVRFQPDNHSETLRAELSGGRKCVAVYAGLHGVAQGLDQILQAAAQLKDVKDLAIALVGDGPEKQLLQDRAKEMGLDNVRFLAPVAREKMPALLASSDISLVVLKSRLPGAVPSKIYEAMGAGIPIILAAEGEAAQIVSETRSGIAVNAGDTAGIATALRDLAQSRERRMAMGRCGRIAAVERFNRQKIAKDFIDLLEHGVSGKTAKTNTSLQKPAQQLLTH